MKNIHLLPTDKPSRLRYFCGKLELMYIIPKKSDINFHHIYITSDEQPKHNDYYTTDGKEIYYCNTLNPTRNNHYKKVILTTDPDLIADGVQAIDDEFLEWFVKNPSCESVDIYPLISHTKLGVNEYKIIIPQEELVNPNNQEIMFHEEHQEYFYEDIINGKKVTVWLGKDYIPQEEPKQDTVGKVFYKSADKTITVYRQETLEDTAKKFTENLYYKVSDADEFNGEPLAVYDAFIEGAKWQQERSYSEEDLILLLNFVSKEYNITNGIGWFCSHDSIEEIQSKDVLNNWFEQFKKK
jgi:hypothetical protein